MNNKEELFEDEKEELFEDEKVDPPKVDQEEVDDWGRRLDTYLYCLNGSSLSTNEKCERLEVLNQFLFEWDHRFRQTGRTESLWNVFIVDFIDLMEMIVT